MTEIWKPIMGYEGLYAVSDKGRVKSLISRTIPVRNHPVVTLQLDQIIEPKSGSGYQLVNLYNYQMRNRRSRVHCLVLENFVGPRPGATWPPSQRRCDRQQSLQFGMGHSQR